MEAVWTKVHEAYTRAKKRYNVVDCFNNLVDLTYISV
jgi:hypothetical protein